MFQLSFSDTDQFVFLVGSAQSLVKISTHI